MSKEIMKVLTPEQIEIAIGEDEDSLLIQTTEDLLTRGLKDDKDLGDFAETLAALDKRRKDVIKSRTALMAPVKKYVKEIETGFNDHAEKLLYAYNKINPIFINYQKRKQAEAEEVLRQKMIEKQKAEETERIAEAAKGSVSDMVDAFDAPLGQQADMPAPGSEPEVFDPEPLPEPKIDAPKIKTESGATVKLIEKPTPIIKDKSAVPDIYKIIDERKLINAWHDGVKNIPGVVFEIETTTGVR